MRLISKLHLSLLLGTIALSAPGAIRLEARAEIRLPDAFAELGPWTATASDDANASLVSSTDAERHALRLTFDLAGTAGYASMNRRLPLDFPDNFELSFFLRANAKVNNFQVKFADATGENVWWFERQDFEFPTEWRRITIKKTQIAFAWGPTSDHSLRHTETLEFVVSAGRGGGQGAIEISELRLRALPPESSFPPMSASASSYLSGHEPARALDGDVSTAWHSDPKAGPAQTLTVDLGVRREFGGLELDWQEGARPFRYDVEASDDGSSWRLLRRVTNVAGTKDALRLPDQEARFIRLDFQDGGSAGYGLSELAVKDVAFGASPNALIEAVAKRAPRGFFPRAFSGEQPYWTLVGIDGGGNDSGLLSEDGALEVGRGGFSIEPFILSDAGLVTWADVKMTHSLVEGYLPIPSTTWERSDWSLRVTAFARGSHANPELVASYALTNHTDRPQSLRLCLAVRPFQVNPPSQFLNLVGGVSSIRSLDWDGAKLSVNGEAKLVPLTPPNRVDASPFQAGIYPEKLLHPAEKSSWHAADDEGLASGVLVYDVEIAPRATSTVGLIASPKGVASKPDLDQRSAEGWIEAQQKLVESGWRSKLNRVEFDVPASAQPLIDTLRSSLVQILMTRDGPVLRPGTRAYARSWIRDGTMMSEALARLGHAEAAAEYLRWFAPRQFESGKVPCCVDSRGADPIAENDSNGELIFLAAEVFRYTGDRALLQATWPNILAAVHYMDRLRAAQRIEANLARERRMLFGLLPPSISHEGYASKPAYSYWDGFWALLGYKSAVEIARTLGQNAIAAEFARARDEFSGDLSASVRTAAEVHGISYVPGAADLGDFDATSTTIALAPAGLEDNISNDLLAATFERYWRGFTERRDGKVQWGEYTPYELRLVGAFVRLGWRQRAKDLLQYFLQDRRPQGWNQWAEVVGRDARQPRFIGDMPHAWIASDYIRSVLDMFVYERGDEGALVLAAGIPHEWFDTGFGIKNVRTRYGSIEISVKRHGAPLVIRLSGDAKPPGGFYLQLPQQSREASEDMQVATGGQTAPHKATVHVVSLPAEIVVGPDS